MEHAPRPETRRRPRTREDHDDSTPSLRHDASSPPVVAEPKVLNDDFVKDREGAPRGDRRGGPDHGVGGGRAGGVVLVVRSAGGITAVDGDCALPGWAADGR